VVTIAAPDSLVLADEYRLVSSWLGLRPAKTFAFIIGLVTNVDNIRMTVTERSTALAIAALLVTVGGTI
jgi:hypothetical protein